MSATWPTPPPTRPTTSSWRLDADAEDVGRGLSQLVLAVMELVRGLLERQAIRRVDAGALSDEQVERLGRALLALEDRLTELREQLGATDADPVLPADLLDGLLEDAGARADEPDPTTTGESHP